MGIETTKNKTKRQQHNMSNIKKKTTASKKNKTNKNQH